MAKNKKNKNKNKKGGNKKSDKKSIGILGFMFALASLISMIMFLPVTLLLGVGMLPTMVAVGVDREPGKNKAFTIGIMNFAGCYAYFLELLQQGGTMDASVSLLIDPKTIIVMYSAAALGYMINWGVSIAVSSIMVQRSKMRLKRIEEEKQALKDRWGTHVNGKFDLDEHGFPVIVENVETEKS